MDTLYFLAEIAVTFDKKCHWAMMQWVSLKHDILEKWLELDHEQAIMALQEMAVLNGSNVIYGFVKFFILIYW